MGRLGADLIAQAKSGTGKTAVFSVLALETALDETNADPGECRVSRHTTPMLAPTTEITSSCKRTPRTLVIAPTREIAIQTRDVIRVIGLHVADIRCDVFMGGLPLVRDKRKLMADARDCDIAVGTPGRLLQLITMGILDVGLKQC